MISRRSPLFYASKRGYLEIVAAFVDKGAEIDQRDYNIRVSLLIKHLFSMLLKKVI